MRFSRGLVALAIILFVNTKAFAEETSADGLIAFLQSSQAAYERVNDYRAMFEKQELSDGKLAAKETIFMKFEKPFKIFMRWIDTEKKGLQVFYERGKHGGKLGIHKPGLFLGLVPVVFLDRSSPWVREGSESYDIEDAGIGSFLTDFSAMVRKGRSESTLTVRRFETTPKGTTVEVIFPGTRDKDGYFAYRVEVYFDAANSLPVRMSLFDWDDRTTGIYAYNELVLNVGTKDPLFKKQAQRHFYDLFQSPLALDAKR